MSELSEQNRKLLSAFGVDTPQGWWVFTGDTGPSSGQVVVARDLMEF